MAQYIVRDPLAGSGSAVAAPKKRVYKKKVYPKVEDEVLPPREQERIDRVTRALESDPPSSVHPEMTRDESVNRPLTLAELKALRGY